MTTEKHLHRTNITVRWGDMDAFGHVNNTVYFRYMEQTRVDWMISLNHPLTENGVGMVIVTAECAFKKAITYPSSVNVDMYSEAPGRSSFNTTYVITDQEKPELIYATGSSVIVWIDHAAEKSVPLPDSVRKLLLS